MAEHKMTEQELKAALELRNIEASYHTKVMQIRQKVFESFYDNGAIRVKVEGSGKVLKIDIAPMYASTHLSEQIGEAIANCINNCRAASDAEEAELTKWLQDTTMEALEAAGQGITSFPVDIATDGGDDNL